MRAGSASQASSSSRAPACCSRRTRSLCRASISQRQRALRAARLCDPAGEVLRGDGLRAERRILSGRGQCRMQFGRALGKHSHQRKIGSMLVLRLRRRPDRRSSRKRREVVDGVFPAVALVHHESLQQRQRADRPVLGRDIRSRRPPAPCAGNAATSVRKRPISSSGLMPGCWRAVHLQEQRSRRGAAPCWCPGHAAGCTARSGPACSRSAAKARWQETHAAVSRFRPRRRPPCFRTGHAELSSIGNGVGEHAHRRLLAHAGDGASAAGASAAGLLQVLERRSAAAGSSASTSVAVCTSNSAEQPVASRGVPFAGIREGDASGSASPWPANQRCAVRYRGSSALLELVAQLDRHCRAPRGHAVRRTRSCASRRSAPASAGRRAAVAPRARRAPRRPGSA